MRMLAFASMVTILARVLGIYIRKEPSNGAPSTLCRLRMTSVLELYIKSKFGMTIQVKILTGC